MASSQVQVSSSSPFGCVLRDRNHRDRCSPRGSNSFQKNLKDLVHSCIVSRQTKDFNSDSDENEVDLTDLWVHKPQYLNNRNDENNQWNSNRASANWRKARDIVFPDNEISLPKSETSSVEFPHLGGVSSLVRKWSDFEAEKKPSNGSIRSNSGSDACEESSIDGRSEVQMIEDSSSLGGWESDRTPKSGPPSVRGTDSDAAESERIRVADIIRKLSSNAVDENHDREPSINGGNEAALPPRIRTSFDHQPEQLRCFSPVLNSPRILRGRQAFNSFLMQVERERARELEVLVERKAVSKFQQRGRIQAVLRLKLLRRGTEARYDRCTLSESNRKPQSSISHLRERFNAGVPRSVADSKAMPRKVPDSNADAGKISVSNQSRQQNHHHESSISHHREVVDSTSTNGNVPTSLGLQKENHLQVVEQITSGSQRELAKNILENNLKIHHREVVDNSTSYQLQEEDRLDDLVEQVSTQSEVAGTDPLSSREEVALITQHSGCSLASNQHNDPQQQLEHFHAEARWIRVSSEVGCSNKSIESAETASPINNSEITWMVEQRKQQVAGANDGFSIDGEEDVATNQQPVESDCGWLCSYSQIQSAWDDLQSGFPEQPEVAQDWLTDVSRPRSEWEDLRQARYQEMLDPYVDKNDIRELLQRRSVSNFLSGSMRDKIDQMIMSRSQRQPTPVISNMQEEVSKELLAEDEGKEVEDIFQGGEDEEEYKEDRSGDEYEGDSEILEQPDDVAAVVNHTWGHNQDRNISIDPDQIASTSLPQPQSANFYSQRPYASSTRHPSIEIELIYELRGHMEQLHQEMSEIRSSVKSCMNMQVKLQHSIKREVAAALSQSGQKSRRGSSSKHPSNGKCCICREMKIDSLLYRCGHMCTCFKCAHKLVWGSGKCPICEAPILDVVRAVYAP